MKVQIFLVTFLFSFSVYATGEITELNFEADYVVGVERTMNIDDEIAKQEELVQVVINEITGERQLASQNDIKIQYLSATQSPELK